MIAEAVARAPATKERQTVAARVVLALAAVVVAYHYSLNTLLRGLSVQTPLAYLGTVPLVALALVASRARPTPSEPEVHDRQLDWILGTGLVLVAVAILTMAPGAASTRAWELRLDLLSLPFFCAGVIAFVFGARTLFRLRLPLGFLLLGWPVPWTTVLGRLSTTTAACTTAGLHGALRVLTVASPVTGGDGSMFRVGHGAANFTLSVASPCSGVNGAVGFVLVGGGFALLLRGSWPARATWLACGLVLGWVLNVGRILAIFVVGARYGQGPAMAAVHPYLGLVTFSAGVLAMTLVTPCFGLSLAPPPTPEVRSALAGRAEAVPRVLPAVLAVLMVSGALGIVNSHLRQYESVVSDLGAPRLAAFTSGPAPVSGWSARQTDRYDWARSYFGSDSTWLRFYYESPSVSVGSPVIADAVIARGVGPFEDYGLEACYRFHGYHITERGRVGLQGGLIAQTLSYRSPKTDGDWAVVAWIWPVATAAGRRYERVVLMHQGGPEELSFLTGFARAVVAHQGSAPTVER